MFQNPTYFFALFGLLIPLAIHLWNRRQGKILKIGSIRWLIASENTHFSQIRLNEIALLLLRSLLLLIFVLILVDIVFLQENNADSAKEWILLDRTLLHEKAAKEQISELEKQGFEVHLFEKGFPKANIQNVKSYPNRENINYWSYLKELDNLPQTPQKIKAFVRPHLQNFSGKKPTLKSEIEWISFPEKDIRYFLADAFYLSDDSLSLQIGISEESGLRFIREKITQSKIIKIPQIPTILCEKGQVFFENKKTEALKIREIEKTKMLIYYSNEFESDRLYLKAALEAIAEYLGLPLQIEMQASIKNIKLRNEGFTHIFWLSGEDLSSNSVALKKAKFIQFKEELQKDFIVRDAEKENLYYLHKRLNPQANPAVLESGLAENLLKLLFTNTESEERINKLDSRQIDKTQIQLESNKEAKPKQRQDEKLSVSLPLWFLLLILFFVERWMRKR